MLMPQRDRANTVAPGGGEPLDETTDFQRATMNIEDDGAQNMFSPEAVLSDSKSKPNLAGEEALNMTVGEGPHGTLDVINEKNSEMDPD